MTCQSVIFDLDGTLLDTLTDLGNSVNHALAQYHLPSHPISSYRYRVGNGVRNMVQCSLPQDQLHLLDDILAEQKSYYLQHCTDQTKPYPGILTLLSNLKNAGLKLAVLSNKPHFLTTHIVKHYFDESLFSHVMGHQPPYPLKPDPASALKIASELNCPPDQCLFIGDTPMDIQTAQNAEMDNMGVLWGFRSEKDLTDAKVRRLAQKPQDILNFIFSNR